LAARLTRDAKAGPAPGRAPPKRRRKAAARGAAEARA
jgi:hypothetical protein